MIPKEQIEARHKGLGAASFEELRVMWADDSLSITDYAFLFPILLDLIDELIKGVGRG